MTFKCFSFFQNAPFPTVVVAEGKKHWKLLAKLEEHFSISTSECKILLGS